MNIYKKLFAIQQGFKAKKDKRNEFGKFNYRSAESMITELKPLLNEQQLVLMFEEEITSTCENGLIMKCTARLIDTEDGETITNSSMVAIDREMKGMCSSQSSGASISYIRKYCMCGLLSVDDGSNELDAMDMNAPTTNPGQNIMQIIDNCETIDQLNKLYQSFTPEQQQKYSKCFTFRKNKIQKGQK